MLFNCKKELIKFESENDNCIKFCTSKIEISILKRKNEIIPHFYEMNQSYVMILWRYGIFQVKYQMCHH